MDGIKSENELEKDPTLTTTYLIQPLRLGYILLHWHAVN